MKSAVITFPGSNCDRDAVVALQKIGSKVTQVWHQESKLDDDFDLIVVPGGFTYGDYLRVGAMASISPAMTEVKRLATRGTKILGICNGFQILTEAGLLPGALTRNKEMRFVCRQTYLRVEDEKTVFTKNYQKHQAIKIPVAHMDGNFFADAETLKRIEGEGMIAFRYCDENGNVSEAFNFNGSQLSIAGVFNEKKNVLGLMPHPERAVDINTGSSDGLAMFEGFL